MITQTELNAIKERAEKATAGSAPAWHTPKWYVDEEYPDTVRNSWDCELIAQSIPTIADAEFIAHAREDIPKLVAEIERLKSAIAEAISDIETISPHEAKKTLMDLIKNMEGYK